MPRYVWIQTRINDIIYLGLLLCIYNIILVIVFEEKNVFLKFSWSLNGMDSTKWSDMMILNNTLTYLSPSLGTQHTELCHLWIGDHLTLLLAISWPMTTELCWVYIHIQQLVCITYHTVLDDGDGKNSDATTCPIKIQVLHVSKLSAPLNTSASQFICI
jgi:hypothetical protein